MDWFYEFVQDNAATIGSVATAALVLIVLLAWVDRHPKRNPPPPQNEPRRDDE